MKIKKLIAMLLCFVSVFMMFASTAQAEEKVSVDVYIVETYIFGENYFYKSTQPIIDRMFDVAVKINGLKTISSCKFSLDFNDEILRCESNGVGYSSSDINYMPMSESVVSDGKINVHIFDDKGIARPDMFSFVSRFSVLGKGKLDVNVDFTELVDGNGKKYDPDVNVTIPEYSYKYEEIPKVLPDFETSLSYGSGLSYVKTELAYPMTVSEFTSGLRNADNCEVVIKNADGEILGADDKIPTDAVLTVILDKMIVFKTTFILIGDVNSDGKINAADARKLLRYVAKLENYSSWTDTARIAANTAKDTTELTAADAREILRYSARIGKNYSELYEYHCILEKYNRDLINDNL